MAIGTAVATMRSWKLRKSGSIMPLDVAIDGARGILFNVTGPANLSLWEYRWRPTSSAPRAPRSQHHFWFGH